MRSSWETIETRLLLASSTWRSWVTSTRIAVTPIWRLSGLSMGTARGRRKSLFAVDEKLDGGTVALRLEGAVLAFDFFVEGAEPIEAEVVDGAAGLDAEIDAGGIVGDGDDIVGGDDEDGIGEAVDGELGGLLAAHDAVVIDSLEFAQAGGHGIEGDGKLADFVLGADGEIEIEISLADFASGTGEIAKGAEDADAGGPDDHGGEGGAGDDENEEAVADGRRGFVLPGRRRRSCWTCSCRRRAVRPV